MQTPDELNQEFGLPDHLRFDEPFPGMPRASISTPACTAELYLQGGHLTQWQPGGAEPVLFLSSRSAFVPGKAIRGGIPVIFPWFGAPANSPVKPAAGSASHGYARTWPWTLRFAALAGDDLHLSLTLDHDQALHALGYDFLQLGLEIVLGRALTVRLTAANTGTAPFLFEEALHTYLHVGDVRQISIDGLAGTEYLDKPDDFKRKTQNDPAITFHSEVDRPYLNTDATATVTDPVLKRRLAVSKSNSQSTVIWNPDAQLASKLADMGPGEWQNFVCVETANVAENAITLQPQQAHTMSMELRVVPV